eukprot:9677024-Alexandrium_andersonii.AAC.1
MSEENRKLFANRTQSPDSAGKNDSRSGGKDGKKSGKGKGDNKTGKKGAPASADGATSSGD